MENIWAWNAFKGGHYHGTHFASENRDAKWVQQHWPMSTLTRGQHLTAQRRSIWLEL